MDAPFLPHQIHAWGPVTKVDRSDFLFASLPIHGSIPNCPVWIGCQGSSIHLHAWYFSSEIAKKNTFEDYEKKDKIIKNDNIELENNNEEKEQFLEIENNVLEIIKQNEEEEGASWDSITEKCEKSGLDKDTIEEVINSLMDKGLIFEPILGIIKTT